MTTINGRTPEEIKKGLECCKPKWERDRWISCSDDCPFMNEGTFCRIKMQACVSAYIQQLERERDALIESLLDNGYLCSTCAHNYCDVEDEPCKSCEPINGRLAGNWQWRGVEVE